MKKLKAIILDGQIISICEEPHYIKRHPYADCYVQCDQQQAIGISIPFGEHSGIYSVWGNKEKIPGTQEVIIQDDNGQKYFYEVHNTATKSAENIGVVEGALCDSDNDVDQRLALIEEVLCELDV